MVENLHSQTICLLTMLWPHKTVTGEEQCHILLIVHKFILAYSYYLLPEHINKNNKVFLLKGFITYLHIVGNKGVKFYESFG